MEERRTEGGGEVGKERSKPTLLWRFQGGHSRNVSVSLFSPSPCLFLSFPFSAFLCLSFTHLPPLPPVKTDGKGVVCFPCLQPGHFQAPVSSTEYRRLLLMSPPNLYPAHPERLLPCDRDSGVGCRAFVCHVQSLSAIGQCCPEFSRKLSPPQPQEGP